MDALIWAQEEADLTLRELKIKSIYRAHWTDNDDVVMIPKGQEGDVTDRILADIIKKLRSSGRLQKLFSKIHMPYNDWQPSKMNW